MEEKKLQQLIDILQEALIYLDNAQRLPFSFYHISHIVVKDIEKALELLKT